MTKPSRDSLPFLCPDISALARHLHKAVRTASADDPPALWNHSRWLAVLARSAGHSNYQAWLAAQGHRVRTVADPAPSLHVVPSSSAGAVFAADKARLQKPPSAHAASLASLKALAPGLADDAYLRVLRALSYLDSLGSLLRWPTKRGLADLLLWPLWLRIEENRRYSEGEITSVLAQLNHFGDPVTLRRELIGAKLLGRESDGSAYWKLPRPDAATPPEAAALLAAVRQKLATFIYTNCFCCSRHCFAEFAVDNSRNQKLFRIKRVYGRSKYVAGFV